MVRAMLGMMPGGRTALRFANELRESLIDPHGNRENRLTCERQVDEEILEALDRAADLEESRQAFPLHTSTTESAQQEHGFEEADQDEQLSPELEPVPTT